MTVSEIDNDLVNWNLPVVKVPPFPTRTQDLQENIFSLKEYRGSSLSKRSILKLSEKSKIFETEGTRISSGRIGGINGINTVFDEASQYADALSKLSGNFSIEWVYNATHSIVLDTLETVFVNYRSISSPATLLKNLWKRFHREQKDNPQAKYLQFCHSQGAAHVKNALITLPKEVRDRVIVVAIAPAAIIPKDLCFQSYNYASRRDLIHYGEIVADTFLAPQKVRSDYLAYQELIVLDPDPEAELFDHAFLSPTFERIIENHIEQYLQELGNQNFFS